MQIKAFIEIRHLMVVAYLGKSLAEFAQLLLQRNTMVMDKVRG